MERLFVGRGRLEESRHTAPPCYWQLPRPRGCVGFFIERSPIDNLPGETSVARSSDAGKPSRPLNACQFGGRARVR
jgi:hypothetical protein